MKVKEYFTNLESIIKNDTSMPSNRRWIKDTKGIFSVFGAQIPVLKFIDESINVEISKGWKEDVYFELLYKNRWFVCSGSTLEDNYTLQENFEDSTIQYITENATFEKVTKILYQTINQ